MSVWWLNEIDTGEAGKMGGKAANLGELTRAGFLVPAGFVIDVDEYQMALQFGGARAEFDDLLAQLDVAAGDEREVETTCARLQEVVRRSGVTITARKEIERYFGELNRPLVAVRSSATAEDASDTSFAGVHASFTNVTGDDLIDRIVDCWASLFSPRAVAYRLAQNITEQPKMAVVVQAMVDADCSGVAFTVNPATGSRDEVLVEAGFGLGESVVGGSVEPDTYVVRKSDLSVIRIHIGHKTHRVSREDGQERKIELSADERDQKVLDDPTLRGLVRTLLEVENHFGTPQDVEWSVSQNSLSLLQTRPVTTAPIGASDQASAANAVLSGMGASLGIASGIVRVVQSPHEADQLRDGEVLVAPMTEPDWLPAIRRATALITDQGGMTCHAAIVARELGLPCVVGARSATAALRPGGTVTVDGSTGVIYEGVAATTTPSLPPVAEQVRDDPGALVTQIYVNLAMTDQAPQVAAMPVDGVGLLRAEFMLHDVLRGQHPGRVISWGKQEEATQALTAAILQISQPFMPRPVIYRTADFRSNEFRNLAGGEQYEPRENNPMLGYRGCYRYVRDPRLFHIELEALARVREQTPNVHVMLPFVRTRWELEQCLDILDRSPLGSSPGLRRWIMAEVPSVCYWLPEYVSLGVDGVSIGSNDLTQLVLGVDRDSETCAPLFDEHDPAVLDAIQSIIGAARRSGISSSLCGQAPSEDPTFAEYLVRAGITSVSVNPDAVDRARRVVGAVEQQILLDSARGR